MAGSNDIPDSTNDANSDSLEKRPFQFTLRTMLLWVAGFALLCGLLTSLIDQAREAARHSACQNHLKQIGLALLNYHDAHGHFPPAYVCDKSGKPAHSWRVLILPFIEEQALYDQYDFSEPWNGPNNSKLAPAQPWGPGFWQCPSGGLEGTLRTNYVAVVGPKTIWPGSDCTKLADEFRSEVHTLPEVQTIMVVEITDSHIHWMEPRDLTFEEAMAGIQPKSGLGISSEHPKGIVFVNASEWVHVLERDIDPEELRKLLTADPKVLEVVEPNLRRIL
jgi:hypothetical protein